MITRRSFLGTLAAAVAAPAIVQVANLMPVVPSRRVVLDGVIYDVVLNPADFGYIARAVWGFDVATMEGVRKQGIYCTCSISPESIVQSERDTPTAGIPLRARQEMERMMRQHYVRRFA